MVVRNLTSRFGVLPLRYFSTFFLQNGVKTLSMSHYGAVRPGPRFALTTPNLPFSTSQIRNFASKSPKRERKGSKVVTLSPEEMNTVVDVGEYETALTHVLSEFRDQLTKQFTLRTSTATFSDVIVDVKGRKLHLDQIAQITFKTPQLVMINFSSTPEYVQPTVTALNASGLNLNPQVEGHVIYLPIPKISREHREALAKGAKGALNKSKDRIKHIQNTYITEAKTKEELSQDLVHNIVQKLMQLADHYGKELDVCLQAKQKELLGSE